MKAAALHKMRTKPKPVKSDFRAVRVLKAWRAAQLVIYQASNW